MSSSFSVSDVEKWNKFKNECDDALHDSSKNKVVLQKRKNRLLITLQEYKDITTNLRLGHEYANYDQLLSNTISKKEMLDMLIAERADAYFKEKLRQEGCLFISSSYSNKTSGVQEGKIVTIKSKKISENQGDEKLSKTQDIKTTRYFIKTHQHGSSNKDYRTKDVDPKELFVYKTLEYSHFGESVHFIKLSDVPGDLLIVTEDAASSGPSGSTFNTFNSYQIERLKNHSPLTLDEEKAMVNIDLVSKIFHLNDVITNGDNFGYVQCNGNISRWSIIDFRIDVEDLEQVENVSSSYKKEPAYQVLQKIRHDILEKDTLKKVMIANSLLKTYEEKEISLEESMQKSMSDVSIFIKQNHGVMGVPIESVDQKIKDLRQYGLHVSENINNLYKPNNEYISDCISKVKEQGRTYSDDGKYEDALNIYREFLGYCELYDKLNDNVNSKKMLVTALYQIGSTELKLNKLEDSKETLFRAIKQGKPVLDQASIRDYQEKLEYCEKMIAESTRSNFNPMK